MSKKSQSHEGIQGQELRLDLQNSVEARSEPEPRAASYHSRMARYFGMSPELSSLASKPLFVYLVGQDRDQALSQNGLTAGQSILDLSSTCFLLLG